MKKWLTSLSFATAMFVATSSASAEGVTGDIRSEHDIAAFIAKHPIAKSQLQTYVTAPTSATVGKTENTAALNSVNLVRYLTDLPQVKEHKNFSDLAQNAAFLMNKNNQLAHQIPVPPGMSSTNKIYKKGAIAGLASNIGAGYPNIQQSILNGYIVDNGSNKSAIGHRKWLLNPTMRSIGFGKVGNYTDTYVFDNKASVNQQLPGYYKWSTKDLQEPGGWGLAEKNNANTKIAWPAQRMPLQLMTAGTPFSLAVGKNYTISDRVKITMKNSKKSVTIDSKNLKSGQHYSISPSGYGYMNAIVWHANPNDFTFKDGDTYTIKITGLLKNKKATTINYKVRFFDLEDSFVKPSYPKTITLKKGKSYTFKNLQRFDFDNRANIDIRVSNSKSLKKMNNVTFKSLKKGTAYVTVTNKIHKQTKKIKVVTK